MVYECIQIKNQCVNIVAQLYSPLPLFRTPQQEQHYSSRPRRLSHGHYITNYLDNRNTTPDSSVQRYNVVRRPAYRRWPPLQHVIQL